MDKPPVIKENRESQNKRIRIYSLLVVAIVAGACVYESFMLKETLTNEDTAWDREESFYNNIRKKGSAQLSVLSRDLEKSNKEKIDIERRLDTILSDKDTLEKEKKELSKNLREVEAQAKETLARKEQELNASLSRAYEKEITVLKQKINGLEKLKEGFREKEELEELERKNRELLDSLIKANQSNEYLMKKIEDLQKIRNELEKELRRGKEETSSSW